MDEQRKQLVQPDTRPPPVGKRGGLVIGGEDPVEVRTPEQLEHGEVALPMATMRGGIDEPHTVSPQHVATPQVAMQTRRWLSGPGKLDDPLTHGLDWRRVVQSALVNGCTEVGKHPVLGVPLRPASAGHVAHGRQPDPRVNRPSGRRDPERARPGLVQRGQLAPKPLSSTRRGPPNRHGLDDQPLIVKPDDRGHLWTTTARRV